MKKIFYRDLLNINTIENNEEFVGLLSYGLKFGYMVGMNDMQIYRAGEMKVRKSVAEKLVYANQKLKERNINLSLYVTYGYRNLEIQTKRFQQRMEALRDEGIEDTIELYERIHTSVAIPTVAGHPTGGAVDVLIVNNKTNTFVDFGTPIYNYSRGGHEWDNQNISHEAKNNRKLLQECMIEAGFAPYHGEYRHFSYGDKEWAHYYDQQSAIYDQKSIREIMSLL